MGFWASEPDLAKHKVDEHIKQIILKSPPRNLPLIEDQLDLIDHETEIFPGIHTISAPGHTPGHIALRISSGGEHLLFSDTVLSPIHLEQPDWFPVFDLEHEQAAPLSTRFSTRLLLREAWFMPIISISQVWAMLLIREKHGSGSRFEMLDAFQNSNRMP